MQSLRRFICNEQTVSGHRQTKNRDKKTTVTLSEHIKLL